MIKSNIDKRMTNSYAIIKTASFLYFIKFCQLTHISMKEKLDSFNLQSARKTFSNYRTMLDLCLDDHLKIIRPKKEIRKTFI